MPKFKNFKALLVPLTVSMSAIPFLANAEDLAPVDSLELQLPHPETIEGNVYAARCESGLDRPAVKLRVQNFKDREGNIRVQLYNDKPDEFLEKGKKLLRIEFALPDDDTPVDVCVPLEEAGTYALFLLHDRNGNGKANVFSEGFGISNNPKMKLRRPRHDEAAFEVGNEVLDMEIDLQYFGGDKRRRRR